jgi:hypothetical protein
MVNITSFFFTLGTLFANPSKHNLQAADSSTNTAPDSLHHPARRADLQFNHDPLRTAATHCRDVLDLQEVHTREAELGLHSFVEIVGYDLNPCRMITRAKARMYWDTAK